MRTAVSSTLTSRGFGSWIFVGIVGLLLIVDMVLFSRLRKAQRVYQQHIEEDANDDNKRYISYYKKRQYIQTMRAVMWVSVILFLIVRHNPNVFAGMAIALGAFVITFGSFFVSLFMYIQLMSRYTPGDSVKVGDHMGEIMQITPLFLQILGKNETGEHTGELINVPNHEIRQKQIIKIDLSLKAIQKVSMIIPFQTEQYPQGFDQFMSALEGFLDDNFAINTAKTAHHYKSYKGYKYKIAFDTDRDGITIKIGFLCQRAKVPLMKRRIISFAESMKTL